MRKGVASGSYLATVHHRTSRLPDVSSIAGSFTKGKDVMTTLNPELTFRMEARDGHFYQTAVRQKRARISKRAEQFGLIIGSATKGQTYLYWRTHCSSFRCRIGQNSIVGSTARDIEYRQRPIRTGLRVAQ